MYWYALNRMNNLIAEVYDECRAKYPFKNKFVRLRGYGGGSSIDAPLEPAFVPQNVTPLRELNPRLVRTLFSIWMAIATVEMHHFICLGSSLDKLCTSPRPRF